MSQNNQEIPGFYRDPVTGKYYADKPGISSSPALKKLKIERGNSNEFQVTPKITNVVRYLNARETRAIGGVQESREYLKMRLHLKESIRRTPIESVVFPCIDIEFITGSSHSIYGFWKSEDYDISAIGRVKYDDSSIGSHYFRTAPGYVIDMCEGFNDDFIAVYNSSHSHTLLAERIGEDSRTILLHSSQRISSTHFNFLNRQIFCCACNKNKLNHAFGSEHGVIHMDVEERQSFQKTKGRTHTISFDDTGDLMVLGMHNGNFVLCDLRINKVAMQINVSKTCLIDSSFLNSNQVVIAGTNDVLCKVDIRKEEVVTEYLMHQQQDIRKAPISIASNMLCAAGSDNRIKIWDLSGGLPLHVMKPHNAEHKIRAWLCYVDNKTSLFCFENTSSNQFEIL